MGTYSDIAGEQIFLPITGKVVCGNVLPQAFRDISGKHRLHQLGHFVHSA